MMNKLLPEPSTNLNSRPFADAAIALADIGLAVVPVAGKVPLVAWQRWRRPPGQLVTSRLANRFPEADIGVLTGLSGLTVVDIDDAGLIEAMVQRFGSTPLQTATPSGGRHLWYRSNGERSANLREREGLAVDIKAAGGFVVVPPSPGYRFLAGSWADLPNLPHAHGYKSSTHSEEGYKSSTHSLRAVGVGRRNDTLFKLLLRKVGDCDTEADLLDVAETIVSQHFELDAAPFPPAEIAKTVRSVWRIEAEGRNWVGKEARGVTTAAELHILQRNPDAYVLRSMLQCRHGARPEPFAVSARWLADCEFIDGWTDFKRYARARDFLVEHAFLAQTHKGGSGSRDPHLYRLSSPVTDYQQGGAQRPLRRGGGVSVIVGPPAVPIKQSPSRRGRKGIPVPMRAGRPTLWARVLPWLREREWATRADLMAEHHVGAGEAQRALKVLCDRGLVEKVGYGQYRARAAA